MKTQAIPEHKAITVPLSLLFVSDDNVRARSPLGDVAELTASIAAFGVLHPLVVLPRSKKGHGVVAGRRRLAALWALHKAKQLPKDHPVPCVVQSDNATGVSLAENLSTEPMHPADAYVAFAKLAEQGHSMARIAATYGLTEKIVRKRLLLGKVAPMFIEMFRANQISQDIVMALTLSDDHERQQQVWKVLPAHERTAYRIRQLLIGSDIEGSAPQVKFVGLAAYKKAGGTIREDLFAQRGEAGVYLTNPVLLNELATAKLQEYAAPLKARGWKWVETRTHFDHTDRATFHALSIGQRAPNAEQAQALAALERDIERLQSEAHDADAAGDEEKANTLEEDIEIAQGRRDALLACLDEWQPEQKAIAGAVVTIDHQGKAFVHEGLVRPDDYAQLKRDAKTATATNGTAGEGGNSAVKVHSDSLARALSAHRSAALRMCLSQTPAVALAALVESLVLQCFDKYLQHHVPCAIKITHRDTRHHLQSAAPDVAQSTDTAHFEERWTAWEHKLPDDPAALLSWLLALPPTDIAELLALCVAAAVDATVSSETVAVPARGLAQALSLDMAQHWTPTAEGYLSRLAKPHILGAVSAATSPEVTAPMAKLKKGKLVVAAEKALAGTGWIPDIFK